MPWPTAPDLEQRLGREFTPTQAAQAEAILADVVGAVRTHTGQQVTAGTSTTRLKVRAGKVRLPQHPVTEVSAVEDMNGNPVEFEWYAGSQVDVSPDVPDAWSWEPRRSGLTYVDVTYDHGDDVPPALFGFVCNVAERVLGTPGDQGGVSQEALGSYSYSTGVAAAAGPVGLLADERRFLDDFFRRPASSAMML